MFTVCHKIYLSVRFSDVWKNNQKDIKYYDLWDF